MPGRKPTEIHLTERQRAILEHLTRCSTSPQRLSWRVKVILLADDGENNSQIADHLHLARHTVGKWRTRWARAALAVNAQQAADKNDKPLTKMILSVFDDAPRSGAPGTFTPEQIVHLVSIACTPPQESGRPISHWSHRELAAEVVKRDIVSSISPRSVGRFLK